VSTTEDNIEGLKMVVVFLMRQVRELTARAETYRVLLEHRGVFSHAEYEEALAQATTEFDRAMGEVLTEAMKVASDAALSKLLQSFQGTQQ
jgi:hypothetical protein